MLQTNRRTTFKLLGSAEPQIVTSAGKSALGTIKPGDVITTVFSQQTAIDATIIR